MNKKAKNVFKFAIPFVLLSTAASIPVITTLVTRSKQIGNQYTKKELDKNQVRKSLKNISKSINTSAKQLNSLNFDYSEMVNFYTNKLSENELEISNFKIKKEVYLKHDELVNEVYNNLNFLTSEGIDKINNDQIFIKFKNNFLLSNSDINDLKHKLNHWKNEVNPFIENLSKKLDELLLLYQNNETLINSLKNKENINLILSSIKNWNEFVLKSVENDDEVEAHLNEFIINLETFNTTINNFKLINSYDSEFIINELNILEVTKDNLNKSIEIIKSNQNIINQTILNANKNIKFYESEINKIIDLLSKDINNFNDKYFNFNSYFNQYYKKMYNSYNETLMNIYKNKSIAVEVSTYINEIKSQLQKDYAANINTLNVTKDEEKLEKTLSFILNLNEYITKQTDAINNKVIKQYIKDFNSKIDSYKINNNLLIKLKDYKQEIFDISNSIIAKNLKIASLSAKKEILKKEVNIGNLDKNNKELKELRINEIEQEIILIENDINELKRSKDKISSKITQIESKLKDVHEKVYILNKLQNESFAASKFIFNLIEYKNVKINMLETEISLLLLQNNLSKKQIDQLNNNMIELKKENNNLKEENQRLQNELNKKQETIDWLNNEINILSDVILKRNKEIERLNLLLQEKENKVRELETEALSLNNRINNLEIIINEKDQTIARMENSINNLNNQINNQNNEINNLNNQNSNNNNTINNLTEKLRKKSEENNRLLADKLTFDENILQLNNRINIINQELNKLRQTSNEKDQTINSLQTKIIMIKNQIKSLKTMLDNFSPVTEVDISNSYTNYNNAPRVTNYKKSYDKLKKITDQILNQFIQMISIQI